MPQIRLTLPEGKREGDLERAPDGSLVEDDGLETLVTVCLFTDAPATDDDGLPQDQRRGYWADAIEEDGDNLPIGSRIWLVMRKTLTSETLRELEQAAADALAPVVSASIVGKIETSAERIGESFAGLTVRLYRPAETSPYRTFTWELHFALRS